MGALVADKTFSWACRVETPMTLDNDFDAYAEDYDAVLAQGLSVSGEDKDYFAQGADRLAGTLIRERTESCFDHGFRLRHGFSLSLFL